MVFIFFFFFSSRRRHTRSYGDWSSDVCSSDLAFAEPDRNSGFLELAEEAVRAQSGDGHILLLAATAALLDADPARAQVFLKRFSKRFVPVAPWHLLRALALGQENKLAAARAVL